MFKLFFASTIVAALAVQSASAGDCCCGSDESSAPATAAAEHQTKTAEGTNQAQTAQRWTETRSYSYEPSYRANNPQTIDGFYAGRINQDPRIIGSFGRRPASDKNLGNY